MAILRFFTLGQCVLTFSAYKHHQKQQKKVKKVDLYAPSAEILVWWVQRSSRILILKKLLGDSEADGLERM